MAWFAIAFLNCSSTNYLQTWHYIFNSEKCKIEFKNILLVAELAFCLPVSTAKLGRSFSMHKHIKRDTRAALGVNRVENLMRISQEGPPLECFDPTNAMKLSVDHVVQRPAQSKCHRNYRKRQSKSIIIIVSPWAQMMMMMSLKCEEHADHTFSKKCFLFFI